MTAYATTVRMSHAVLGALLGCCLGSAATAQVPTAIVVTSHVADAPSGPDLGRLYAAMAERGLAPQRDVSERLEAQHSAPPVRPPEDRLASLRVELETVTRHLALGELQQAIDGMRVIEGMHHDALDFLSREAAQARKLFGTCVMTGYLLHKDGREVEGRNQLGLCAATFPGFQLRPEVFASDVRELYASVIRLGDQTPVWLTVDGIGGTGACEVRLNGVNVGRAPITMRAHVSTVRVQLECGGSPGRVHQLQLAPGKNKLTIDPELEAGLDTSRPIPRLHHSMGSSDARVVRQLLELAQASGVQQLLPLHWDGSSWTAARIDVARAAVAAAVPIDLAAPQVALDTLFPNPAVVARAAAGQGARVPPRTLVGTRRLPNVYWAALGALWLGSPVLSAAMLSHRREIRSRAGRIEDVDTPEVGQPKLERLNRLYNRDGLVAVLGAAVPSVAWAASGPFLPATGEVPWYAWAAGGVGVAMAGVGLAALASSEACGMTDRQRTCGHWVNDPLFAPLLLTHAVAPLSVPASHLIARGLGVPRERVALSVQAGHDSAFLSVGGSF